MGHKQWDRGDELVRLTPCELDGGFVAERLDLPGCISQGETEEEALANLADAADEWLAVDATPD